MKDIYSVLLDVEFQVQVIEQRPNRINDQKGLRFCQ
jgi:hypothetical protein